MDSLSTQALLLLAPLPVRPPALPLFPVQAQIPVLSPSPVPSLHRYPDEPLAVHPAHAVETPAKHVPQAIIAARNILSHLFLMS